MFETIRYMTNSKKGAIEIDELIKLLIAVIVLIIVIVLVTVTIKGELFSQGERAMDIFKF